MKNFFNARIVRLLGIISLALVIGFSMAACSSGGGGDPDLAGTITINPTTAAVNTKLTATYSGSETPVTYQWKKGTTNVGTNSNEYTPTEAGSYTVTVSVAGFKSKTSAPVTVTGGSSGGGGSQGVLTFTGEIPAAILTLMNTNITAGISYFSGGSAILSAHSLPADAEEAEDLIYNASWSDNTKIATLESTIAEIKANNKCNLENYEMDPYTGSGTYLLYIKFDNSGDTLWLAVVTFTNGSGTVAWNALVNANDLGSGSSGGGGGLPAGAVTGLTVPATLVGTWVGDADNGTLVFTATGVGSTGGIETLAYGVIFVLKNGGTIAITDSKITGSSYGYAYDLLTYTISGTTLTIKDADEEDVLFTGTKQ